MRNRLTGLRCISLIAALVVLAATVATGHSAAAPPSLETVILAPQQVGAGYKRTTMRGGRQVAGQVTLDFCGDDYPSEGLRLERFQAVYLSKSSQVGLSNEVVRYRAEGAAQALAEVAQHVRTCPRNTPIPSPVAGAGPITYLRIDRLQDRRLLPGAIAVRVVVEVIEQGVKKRFTSMAVYQHRGNLLSGVYANGGAPSKLTAMTLQAAAASATRLRQSAA